MPVYGTPQAGSNTANPGKNLSAVCVGDTYVLFDGTETPEVGLASVAMARATQGSGDNGTTFYASGVPSDCQVGIQGANEDIDSHYLTLTVIDGADGEVGAYTDVGRAPFYRAILVTFGGGSPSAMPRVTVER